jgi:hypothetical protein
VCALPVGRWPWTNGRGAKEQRKKSRRQIQKGDGYMYSGASEYGYRQRERQMDALVLHIKSRSM